MENVGDKFTYYSEQDVLDFEVLKHETVERGNFIADVHFYKVDSIKWYSKWSIRVSDFKDTKGIEPRAFIITLASKNDFPKDGFNYLVDSALQAMDIVLSILEWVKDEVDYNVFSTAIMGIDFGTLITAVEKQETVWFGSSSVGLRII